MFSHFPRSSKGQAGPQGPPGDVGDPGHMVKYQYFVHSVCMVKSLIYFWLYTSGFARDLHGSGENFPPSR